ncbi:hypothetical protein JCM19992_16550 [Thermostilla marina]
MLRWSYLLPRLLLLSILLFVAWWTAPWIVQHGIRVTGQSLTASRWDVGTTEVSFRQARVVLSDVAVADPTAPMENLVSIEQASLDFDGKALLAGRYVVESGTLSGVRFSTQRDTSGKLDPDLDFLPEWAAQDLADALTPWFDRVRPLLLESIEEQVDSFESVRLARELERRWPLEYRQMSRRVNSIRERIERLQALARQQPQDPAARIAMFRDMLAEFESLRIELEQIPVEIERLERQAEADKQAILAARDRDLERLARMTDPGEYTSQKLAEYLLGPTLGRPLAAILVRLDAFGRTASETTAEPERARGVDIPFPTGDPLPIFEADRLAVDGIMEFDGREIPIVGEVRHLSSHPRLTEYPLQIVFEVDPHNLPWFQNAVAIAAHENTGSGPIHEPSNRIVPPGVDKVPHASVATATITLTFDRRNEIPVTRIDFTAPTVPAKAQRFGNPDKFAIVVDNAVWNVSGFLQLTGKEWSGRFELRESGGRLHPILPGLDGQHELQLALSRAFAEIAELEARIEVSGTTENPRMRLESNLDDRVDRAVQQAVLGALVSQRSRLEDLYQSELRRHLAPLDQLMQTHPQQLLAQWQGLQRDLERLAAQTGVTNQIPDLSRNIPPEVASRIGQALGGSLPGPIFAPTAGSTSAPVPQTDGNTNLPEVIGSALNGLVPADVPSTQPTDQPAGPLPPLWR